MELYSRKSGCAPSTGQPRALARLLASNAMTTRFHKVAVVGAGAVGSFYGAMLARAGQRVVLVGRPPHVEAIQRDGLKLDMAGQVETVRAEASAELAAVQGADLVLFCVKSTDTDTVARELAPLLEPHAVVLSLQNGVENAATIARHVRQIVVPAVVYVATAMVGPGTVKHHGRGDLVIGALNAGREARCCRLRRAAATWSRCSETQT